MSAPVSEREQALLTRVAYLESINQAHVLALDMAASMVHIHGKTSYIRNPARLLEEAQRFLRRLMIDFQLTAFFTVNEDTSDFLLMSCIPTSRGSQAIKTRDLLIESGEFAWALNQNRPLLCHGDQGEQVLLHVLTTRSRVRGMFMGVIADDRAEVSATFLNLLSLIFQNIAYALESAELYRLLDDLNRNLEIRVREGLFRIMNQNQELEARITELHRIQGDLARAKEAAEAASRTKSEFLATMSHEIRTPMNVIIGMGELLGETPLDDEQRQYVDTSQRAGEALLTLINDILDLSRIEAGRLDLVEVAFDPTLPAREAISLLKLKAEEKGIRLDYVPDAHLPRRVVGDPERLRQVLINLLGNAVKFTEHGGVTLEVTRREGEFIHFLVWDTGIGVPQEKWEAIFLPFTQADSSTTRRHGGTGLGLTISQRLVQKMGGCIQVESRAGGGSRFQFTIPLPALPGLSAS